MFLLYKIFPSFKHQNETKDTETRYAKGDGEPKVVNDSSEGALGQGFWRVLASWQLLIVSIDLLTGIIECNEAICSVK